MLIKKGKMKKIIYKQDVNINNLFLCFLILDLKTFLNYLSLFYSSRYQVLYLSQKIIAFNLFSFIYFFSFEKKILNTSFNLVKNKLKYFYFKYKLQIEFVGTGYKFFIRNNFLYFTLGYSHITKIKLPNTCNVSINKNSKFLTITYSNKYILGNIFYILKSCKKLDVYKGKGIKNILNHIRLKLHKIKNVKK